LNTIFLGLLVEKARLKQYFSIK